MLFLDFSFLLFPFPFFLGGIVYRDSRSASIEQKEKFHCVFSVYTDPPGSVGVARERRKPITFPECQL